MSELKEIRSKQINNQVYKVFRVIVYAGCIIFFVVNSYALFIDFLNNPTLISTKVVKSSKLDKALTKSPSILICNDIAYKEQILYTDYDRFRNNTLSLNDFVADVFFVKDIGSSILNAKPRSIKHNVKELFTAFHGTCFLIQEHIKVWHNTRILIS